MFFGNWELALRLLIAAVLGGAVGYERELKGRDAGIRTQTLVCLGAAIITMTQLKTSEWLVEYALQNPELPQVLSSDLTRLTAQIVNGIGFLGAGTIIVSRRSITGLTTAASIWAVAALGIAVGMGYYFMAVLSTVIVLVVLRFVKIAFKLERTKNIEIHYRNYEETNIFLEESFKYFDMDVASKELALSYEEDGTSVCQNIYTCHLPSKFNLQNFLLYIGKHPDVIHITTIKMELES